jgi:NADPH:quinone reductase-like Zn-dependent oxidoreductase
LKDHIINYNEDKKWGETAKKLTPKGEGFAHVLDVGGPSTMEQSLSAIKIDGIISLIGFLKTDVAKEPSFLDCLSRICTARGVFVGSRLQFEDMVSLGIFNSLNPPRL